MSEHSTLAEVVADLLIENGVLTRERDEARAEVARLKADQRIRDAYDGPGAGGCADLVDP